MQSKREVGRVAGEGGIPKPQGGRETRKGFGTALEEAQVAGFFQKGVDGPVKILLRPSVRIFEIVAYARLGLYPYACAEIFRSPVTPIIFPKRLGRKRIESCRKKGVLSAGGFFIRQGFAIKKGKDFLRRLVFFLVPKTGLLQGFHNFVGGVHPARSPCHAGKNYHT